MADQRIQYTEQMVGAGHPTKADTLNRLSLVEHNSDGTHDTTKVAPASKGVTNGDSHNHTGGAGAQLDHANLLNKGTNTHSQIDTALSRLSNTSGTNTGDQDLSTLATKTEVTTGLATKQATLVSGTNIKTVNGTSVLGSGNITVASGVTDHTLLSNIGVYNHSQIDSHVTSTGNPHNTTASQVGFANKLTLDKIGESLGLPTWSGGAWPGGGGTTTYAYVDAGTLITPSYTDNGDGSVTIGSGEYVLYLSETTFPPQRFVVSGGVFTLTDNSVNYIKITCNSGAPVMSASTSRSDINQLDVIPLYTIYRTGTTLVVLDWDLFAVGLANKINDRLVRVNRYDVEPGGVVLGESSGRVVTLTSGYIWSGGNRITSDAYNSSLDSMMLHYKVSGVWTKSTVTSYNNSQYDDGNNLQALSNDRYAVNWLVKRVGSPSNGVCIVLGGGDYTLAQAQLSTLPIFPPEVSSLGVVVGRIIVQKNASTATQIDSAFVTRFGNTTITDHDQLSGLQGGIAGEYYHLTSAELTKLSGISAGAEVNVNADWDAISGDAQILNKPTTFTPSAHTTGSHSDWPIAVDMVEVGYLEGVTGSIQSQINGKQATLVSGTNIKTIFGNSLLGSGDLTFQAGMAASAVSTATTAVKDTRYICDTSAAAFTLTLPATPAAGDYLEIVDAKGTFATNNLTIARNGSVIDGTAEDLVCNIPNIFLTLTYSGNTTRGWQIDLGGEEAILSPDGDKGDITVSESGAKWEINPEIKNQIQPITATVAASALTIGAGALSLAFRSTTLGDGTVTTVTGTPAAIVVPSGATLGTINAIQNQLVVIAMNNAGTIELAVVNLAGGNNLDETTLISTTALSAASDSANVVYSTTARTNLPFRVVGLVQSTQATAGTWATAPSLIQGAGGQAIASLGSLGYGQTWQDVVASRAVGTTYYNTTGKPIAVSVRAGISVISGYIIFNCKGVDTAFFQSYGAGVQGTVFGIVPPGASYLVTQGGGTATLVAWVELR